MKIEPTIHPDPEKLKRISAYMFLPDSPVSAVATIVLGQTLWQRPYEKAIQVYQSGIAGKIIFTGGFNQKLGKIEAHEMRQEWEKSGHAIHDVLVDEHASNTWENMRNVREILKKEQLLKPYISINIITINYHMRRALETLNKVFAEEKPMIGIINYPSIHCAPTRWHTHQKGRDLVMKEVFKLRSYLSIEIT